MIFNFDELEKLSALTPAQVTAFARLKENADFIVFQNYTEDLILKKVYALTLGSVFDRGEEERYLNSLRGFAKIWKSLIVSLSSAKNDKDKETKSE